MYPSLIIIKMILVFCISRSHRLKIDFRDKTLKILLSETTLPRALMLGMKHHFVYYIGLSTMMHQKKGFTDSQRQRKPKVEPRWPTYS